jgi:serine/threonine protein kinase
MIGTPAYMPLEQYRGDKGLTVYSDVFALGVTLIELATGSHPTDWDIASLHRGPAEMLGLESLPAGLRALLCRMVDPVPERRPLPDEVAIEMQKYE